MMDFLKEHADIIIGSLVAAAMFGRDNQRITNLEKAPSAVSRLECEERHANCQAIQSLEIDHLKSEFSEVKNMISKLEQRGYDQGKAQGERHTMLVDMLRDLKGAS